MLAPREIRGAVPVTLGSPKGKVSSSLRDTVKVCKPQGEEERKRLLGWLGVSEERLLEVILSVCLYLCHKDARRSELLGLVRRFT